MSAEPRGGFLLRFLPARVRLAYLAVVVLFLGCVAQFFHRDTGFTSLISIGDQLNETQVTALRQVPHYVYESSPGYDGAYYVQLALDPTLDNPELKKAIDNLPYRARRILFSWTAWALGLGQPAWIVQAHALLNVICWLALGWTLLRWFPPTGWENFARWTAVMFSHGVCMSVRHSLVDAPSLLLVALALRYLEDGRGRAGGIALALAGLGKETSLLATAALGATGTKDQGPRDQGTGKTTGSKAYSPLVPWSLGPLVVQVALVAAPLALWMGYVRWKFGPADDPGLGNFTLPLLGYWEKLRTCVGDVATRDAGALHWATLGAAVALLVQALFFATRWRPAERWWRVGAAFALMMLFLSTPVWEGYPGASTRVLLPMTLAFNILVPRGVRWLPVLIAGNLTVAASVFEFSPPHDFYTVRGDAEVSSAVHVATAKDWHGPERHLDQHWRWSPGRSELRLTNASTQPVRVVVLARASSANAPRKLVVSEGKKLLWSETVGSAPGLMRFGFELPPGETVLTFATDRPGDKIGTDPRPLAFRVMNLEIVVTPAPGAR